MQRPRPRKFLTIAMTTALAAMAGCAADGAPGRPGTPGSAAAPAPAAEPAAAAMPVEQPAAQVAFAEQEATPANVAFTGGVSLWGEVPGRTFGTQADAAENLRQISYSREGADFDVDIDANAKRIAFASTRHRSTSDIYIKSVEGNTITQFTNDLANDVMPVWSPDGSTIAFCSDRAGNWDIYIQALSGGQPFQLTNDASHELHPSFSPDGRELVFCALGTSGQWEMIVVDVANPAKRRILGFGLFPQFSPTGDKIVFQRARQRGSRLFSIWTLDYVNGEAIRPTEIAAATNAAVINPTWSPDGRRLSFSTVVDPASDDVNARPDAADLWAINIDGTARVKLTNDSFANLQPVWGRDGTIYFISNRSGLDNVWALRPTDSGMIAMPNPRPAGAPQAEVPTN